MSNKIWNVITHHETPAFGVGDYDEYYEIVNERGDAFQATEYEGLEQLADALNGYEGEIRISTALEINLHCDNQMLKMENEHLKAENEKLRKALKAILKRCGDSGNDYGQAVYEISEMSYEAIKIDFNF